MEKHIFMKSLYFYFILKSLHFYNYSNTDTAWQNRRATKSVNCFDISLFQIRKLANKATNINLHFFSLTSRSDLTTQGPWNIQNITSLFFYSLRNKYSTEVFYQQMIFFVSSREIQKLNCGSLIKKKQNITFQSDNNDTKYEVWYFLFK